MTSEQEQYIVDNWDKMSCERLRKMFNQKFGTLYKTTAFHYHTKRLGLSKHIEHRYTEEQDLFLCINSGSMTREELTKAFNKKYGTNIKLCAIEQRCFLKGWKAAGDGKFKEGSVPWEKTKGGRDEYVKKLKGGNSTSFKRGHVPFNRYPVGMIRNRKYEVVVKTDDGLKAQHRHLWEQKHGEIPKGYVVISVDGNSKYEKDVSKLRLISNKTLTILMANRWCGNGEVIVDTGIVWCSLYEALMLAGVAEKHGKGTQEETEDRTVQ